MNNQHPRIVAAVVIRQDDRVLMAECIDPITGELYYRPVGGTVILGERGEQTAAQCVQDQLGIRVKSVRFLGAIESVFNQDVHITHEVVLVYEADFVNEQHYKWIELPFVEKDGVARHAVWQFMSDIEDGMVPVYPDGLLDLLVAQEASRFASMPLFGSTPLFSRRRDQSLIGVV